MLYRPFCHIGLAGLLAATTLSGLASASDWRVDHQASNLTFTVQQQSNQLEGVFETFDADIRLDPNDLATAQINVTIDMASATLGSNQQDQALAGATWFAVSQFPTARFSSSDVTQMEDGSYRAEGTLTIRGIEKPLTLPFSLDIEGDVAMAEGTVELMRTKWNVGTGQFASGDQVGLAVSVSFDLRANR